MALLPESWPDEVASYYSELGRRRGWPEQTLQAFTNSVEYYRALDEADLERNYWEGEDENLGHWLCEAVRTPNGDLVPVKQIQISANGDCRRYWWRHIEDDDGFLAEGDLNDAVESLTPLAAESFLAAWHGCAADASLG